MTYYITEVEKTVAKLIVSETRTTSKAVRDIAVAAIRAAGNLAIVREEG